MSLDNIIGKEYLDLPRNELRDKLLFYHFPELKHSEIERYIRGIAMNLLDALVESEAEVLQLAKFSAKVIAETQPQKEDHQP